MKVKNLLLFAAAAALSASAIAQDLKTGEFACISCSLTLGIIEVSRDGNDTLCDRLRCICFGAFLEFAHDH